MYHQQFGEGGRRGRIGGVVGVVESYGNGSGVVHQANNALDKYLSTLPGKQGRHL